MDGIWTSTERPKGDYMDMMPEAEPKAGLQTQLNFFVGAHHL